MCNVFNSMNIYVAIIIPFAITIPSKVFHYLSFVIIDDGCQFRCKNICNLNIIFVSYIDRLLVTSLHILLYALYNMLTVPSSHVFMNQF